MQQQLKCCYGISSKVDRYHHVFMIDYDNISLKDVLEHLIYIQKKFGLSDFYVIESTHGYNAICLDCMPISLIYNIGIQVDSPGDRKFFKIGLKQDFYTLRFDNDKKLVSILRSKNCFYEKSFQHKKFLEWFFDIDIPDSNFIDKDGLTVIQYHSNKNGYHLVDCVKEDYYERGL